MAEIVARVGKINGEAFARNADGELRRVRSGDPIREGEVVQAGGGDEVQLKLADGRELVVRSNEAAKLDAEVAALERPDAGDSSVQNNRTGFAKISKAIVGSDGTFSFDDDGGKGHFAGVQKEGHTFVQLVRVIESVSPLDFQFEASRGQLSDIVWGFDQLSKVPVQVIESTEFELAEASFPSIGSVQQAVGLVANKPQVLSVSIGNATAVNEGGDLQFTVTLSGGTSTSAITIPLTYAGTATPVLDYNGQPVSVIIPAGATSATVTVPTLTDSIAEGNETVTVSLGTPSGGVSVGTGTGTGSGTITDVAPSLSVSIGNATAVNEGGDLQFTVTLSGGTSTSAITIPLTYAGTATPVLDYNGQPVSVIIPAGATSATVTVPTLTDSIAEGNETVTVSLGTPSGGVSVGTGTGTGSGTINDNGVSAGNNAPVADDESFTVAEGGTSGALDLLTGDTDLDGDTLSIKSINGVDLTGGAQSIAVSNGTVNISAGGVITFTPAANYNGPVSFDYVVQDGQGGSDTGTVSGTVTVAGNNAPVADDESFTVAEGGTSGALDLLTGDTDLDGDTLSIKSINGVDLTGGAQSIAVSNGTVNISAGGVITFTPAANYNGPVSFDYVVQDGQGGSDTGTVSGTVTVAGNNAPVADDESFTVAEGGTSGALDLLTGDTDLDGDTLSIKSINGVDLTGGAQSIAVSNGTVNISAGGVITFTPAANYNGPVSFDYVVQDGQGGSDTGTVSGTVTVAGNNAPVADDESFTVAEGGTSGALDLLTGDTDLDGDTLSIKSINGVDLTGGAQSIAVSNGTVNISAGGVITFTPAANYNGPVSFDYVVQDGQGGSDTGTVSGTVTVAGNNAPVADDESFTVAEGGTSGALDLLTGDTDLDGDTLSIKSINGVDLTGGAQSIAVSNGTVNISAGGVITFTPAANYNGPVSFDYVVQDGQGGSDTGTVSGTVTVAGNNAPVADDESFTVAEGGTSGALDLLTGDTDLDGDTLSIKSINGVDLTGGAQSIAVSNGTVNISAGGVITFTPAANYNGPVSFDYVVQDGQGGSDTGTVSGTVTVAGNNAPVADDESFTVAEGGTSGALDLLTGDTDLDGDTLSIKSINGVDLTGGAQSIAVSNGTVNISAGGVITFTPAANYNGPVSFDYVVQDGQGGSDTGTVSGTVTVAGNNAPVADDESFTVAEGGTSGALDLLTGDTDLDGDTLSIKSINGVDLTGGAQSIAVSNGTVNISAGGVITFTPAANYNGPVSFDYVVQDGQGGSDTATVYVTVNPVNDAPDAVDNGTALAPAVTTDEDTAALNINVLGNDTDPDNNPLTVTAASSPNGTVTINPDGTLNFTPAANFNGNTTISYTISDGQGGSDTATVYVTVNPVNDAPDAVDNGTALAPAVTTDEDTAALNINVLGNDTDPDNNPLTVTAASSPNGTVTINPDGTLNFTPAANFNGNTTISYTISDGQGGSDTATVYVTVNPVNDAPDAVDNGTALAPAVTTDEDTAALNINVLGNDTDPDNNPLTVTAASSPNGTVTINPDGTLNFTPAANFNGNTTISYTISDGQGGSDTATVYVTVNPVNDAPDAVDNGTALAPAVTTDEDTAALNINVLGNDTDPDNNPLTVTAASSPNGTVTINPDGTLNFTPAANFNGNTTISYTISDGQGGSDTATVYVTVNPVNDAPDAVDNGTALAPAVTTDEDTAALNINVLGNDTDPDNNPLTVTAASSPNGTVTINPDGTLNFTPAANFNGNTTISYTISDGQGGSDTATVYVTVNPVNDAPDAVDNGTALAPAVTTDEDTAALNINVLGNDTDPDNNPLTVTAASSPNGTVTINPDGTLNFTPAANFNGNTTISYTISDGQGGSDTATVYVTVNPVNDAPDAVDNGTALAPAVTTDEDTAALNINVLGNDTDPDNNPLTVTAASSPNGTVTINPDGTLNFTPAANFNGNTTISYTISDGQGGSDTATVYVTVNPVNDAPDAVDNGTALAPAVTTDEDTAALNINVLGNDTDPDNNPLTVTAASSPNGTVTINPDGTLNFTPAANFNGNTTISYTISDGQGGSDTATVYVTVNPVNDAPDAVDNGTALAPAVTTDEDTAALNINVLGNDTDPDNNPLTVTAASSPNGTVTINPDGTLNFTPAANFNGNTTISYTISDGQGGSDTATVYVTVNPVNDAPDAVDNGTALAPAVTTDEDTAALNINVLGNDTDPDNNPLTVTAASSPNGTVTINPDGTLNFTPAANFNGNTTISYTISDGQGGSDTATVYVTVNPVNDAPDAVDNGTALAPAVTTDEDTAALNINVLGNDTDPDNNPLTVTAASSPNGTVTINPDGTLNFTPAANFNGNTTISYTISDGQGGSDTATVYVTVNPVNDAPDAVDNGTALAPAVTTDEDTAALNINVLGNDTDPDNNPLTVTAASSPNGTVTINPDGTLNFTPAANFNGNTTISYTISDGQGGSDTATVYVTVNPVNDAPDAVDNGTALAPAVTTDEDTAALNINVLGNDTDPDNNPLTVTAASSPNGTVTINPDGTLNFTPAANFNGNTTISYTISDGQGGSDTATVYVTVNPVNDAPDAVDNGTALAPAVTTDEDTAALNINVLGNDTDPDNNPLTVTAASSPNGTVTINPDGTLNFTPAANFNGNTTISYTISDGQGGSDTATVYVTVNPVNDAPDAVDNGTALAPAVTTDEDTAALNINVLGNDTDPDNNPLTVTAASSPNGTVTINPDGTLNFTPAANFNGNTTISYTISDGQGGSDTATVYVTVNPVNDAPDAVDNGTALAPAVTTDEDTAALNINVLGNDTDPDNNPLTVTAASSPNGTVTINPDGTLNFTPAANFNGNTTISYTISDGQGGSDTATVYVTVNPVNDAPDAVDNGTALAPAVTTDEDTAALNINVLGNDTDPDNNPLTVTAASSPNGTVTINPDGTLNFTPAANFNGNTTISYTISDGQGGSDTATVYVTVNPVNDAPDAVDNGTALAPAVTTDEDTAALNINVLGNDTDPDNNPLTVTAASSPNGTVTINPDGTLNFTPAANFNGNTTISYTISDGQGGSDTATVYVTVNPVNDAPDAVDNGTALAPAVTTDEDTAALNINVLGNDTDPDNNPLTVTAASSPNGTVTINPDGTLNFTPAANFNGNTTISYTISDGQGGSDTATVYVTVNPVNDAPDAVDNGTALAPAVTTDEDTAALNINVLGNDTDPDNNPLTVTAASSPNGTVTINPDGTLNFTPAANFNGNTTISYTISDGQGGSDTATVYVTVNPVNDAPDAVDNGTALAPAVTTDEDTAALNINVLGNDTDPDNNPLTVTAASSPNGTVTINPDGTLNFTPAANFNGNTTISYTISDGQGGSDTATVYVTVNPVNDAPDAVDNGTALAPAVTTDEDTAALNINVLGNDTDPDNNPLTVTAASSPNGTVTINPDGTLNFTPAANFNGNTTISYTISDGQGGSDTATVYVTVNPVNDAPDAVDNGTALAPAVTTDEDTAALNINVLGNDTDPDNNPLTVTAASSPNGTVTINPDGTLNFTPAANFNGNTTISYTISDGQGGSDTATVYVTVNPVNDAPDAVDNGTALAPAVTTDEDTAALNINVLGNDTDPDNNPLTVTAASSPNGTVTINPDGTLNFTPAANFNGNTTISYTISDGQGGSDTATVYVTVNPVNDAPDAVDNGTALAPAVTTDEDTAALNINVLGNDTDPDNNPLTVTAASSPNGTVTINPDGTLNFTPAANFNGNTTISYTISDGQGGSDTATVYVTVNPVNDAPDAVDNGTALAPAVTTDEDTAALNINVLGNDTDPDNNPLTVTAASSPNGTVTINPDGTLNFTPAANFNGNTTISYTISDGQGGSDTATVYVTVNPVNDAPDAVDNGTALAPAVTTDEDTAALNINVLGNDTDPDNNPLTVTAASSPNGTVTINPDGTLNFTPAANFNGNTTISYTISDGQGGSDTATVYVTVNPVNDAPASSGGQVYGTEDSSYVFNWGDFNVSDVDTPAASLGLKISTLPADGVLQFSTDGANWNNVISNQLISKAMIDSGWLRFVPDANESGADVFGGSATGNRQSDYASFSYWPNDGADGAAATMRIDIAPDSDAPTLSFGALVYAVTNITAANATTTTNGFNMLAYNSDGSAGTISLRTSGSPNGFGVTGAASGDALELGYNLGVGSEKLVVNFDNLVSSVDVSFAWLAAGERYTVQFLNAGTVVGGYTSTTGGSDNVDPLVTLGPGNGAQFNQIIFTAPASPADSDYLINKIVFNRVTSSNPSIATSDDGIVNLGLASSLVDTDGSETLKVVMSGIPSGFTLTDGTRTFTATGALGTTSSVDVSGWSMSAIQLIVPDNVQGTAHLTATATVTEGSNLDVASVSKTVDVVITHAQTSTIDTVITNTALGTAFNVPMSAFLYNDVGGADSITGTSSANSLTASLSGTNVVITDTGGASNSGGSFSYTASTSVFDLATNSTDSKTSTSSVTVTRDSGDMDGTAADNILVDTSTSATTINGLAGNDVLVSQAASGADTLDGGDGNDLLIGGAGSDNLTGGLGVDTFAWRLADKGTAGSAATTASDMISDFDTVANSDRLDLRDLLVGENHASGIGNLANYIDITASGGDTVIRLSSTGGFTGGTYAVGAEDQRITLSGANLYSSYGITAGDDAALIQKLLTDGKLKVD